jgi:ethanolamine utilization protein EutP
MKKRILIIGPENSDNQQLVNLIEDSSRQQTMNNIVYYDETIYVPSSYLRSPWMLKHIISTQQKAYCLLMLLNTQRQFRVYPPNYAKAFRIPSIGLISKDGAENEEKIESCRKELLEAKVDKIYELDFADKENCFNFLTEIKLLEKNRNK